jgi:hypothetical protein
MISYAIFLNKKICLNLKLSNEIATYSENLLKSIFKDSEQIELLFNRHIDQIIVCCIIAVTKSFNIYTENYYKQIIAR